MGEERRKRHDREVASKASYVFTLIILINTGWWHVSPYGFLSEIFTRGFVIQGNFVGNDKVQGGHLL